MDAFKKQINRFLETLRTRKNNYEQKKLNTIKGENKNNFSIRDKKIESLIVFIVIFSVTLIIIKYIFSSNKHSSVKDNREINKVELVQSNTQDSNLYDIESSEEKLERNLKMILSKINGVGNVDVMVTYSETSKIVPVYNENKSFSKTEETDSSGGTRKIESSDSAKEIVSDNTSSVVTEKIVMPKIEGAIIIAEGGGIAEVKNNIINAVEAATGLKSHKIQVFEMKER